MRGSAAYPRFDQVCDQLFALCALSASVHPLQHNEGTPAHSAAHHASSGPATDRPDAFPAASKSQSGVGQCRNNTQWYDAQLPVSRIPVRLRNAFYEKIIRQDASSCVRQGDVT